MHVKLSFTGSPYRTVDCHYHFVVDIYHHGWWAARSNSFLVGRHKKTSTLLRHLVGTF